MLLAALVLSVACSSAPSSGSRQTGSRSTSDPRVRSYVGQVPPELPADGTWSDPSRPSLAAHRGRTVFLIFAFQG